MLIHSAISVTDVMLQSGRFVQTLYAGTGQSVAPAVAAVMQHEVQQNGLRDWTESSHQCKILVQFSANLYRFVSAYLRSVLNTN
jgi:hypothetical protein